MASLDDNIELTRASFEAFNRGDLEGVLERLSPGVEVYTDPGLPNNGSFHGREGFVEWFGRWVDAWETFRIVPEEYIPVGESLVVCVVQEGRGRGSGIDVTMRAAYVLTIRDGRTTRLHLYPDKEAAVQAAQDWADQARPGPGE